MLCGGRCHLETKIIKWLGVTMDIELLFINSDFILMEAMHVFFFVSVCNYSSSSECMKLRTRLTIKVKKSCKRALLNQNIHFSLFCALYRRRTNNR